MTPTIVLIAMSVALHIVLVVGYFLQLQTIVNVELELYQLRELLNECLFFLESSVELSEQDEDINSKIAKKYKN